MPQAVPARGIGTGIAASVLLHAGLVSGVLWWAGRPGPVRPPVYRVELVGQAGVRQVGVEAPEAPPAAAPETPVAGAERVAKERVIPKPTKDRRAVKPSPKATPLPATRKSAPSARKGSADAGGAPKAGAGATGGKTGADVVNLRTEGITFPFPGYLNNVTRQVFLNWSPRRVAAALVAEVKFIIRRDGSVMGIEVVKRSGDRLYDLDAMGAIEAVGASRGFGRLPEGWSDDVLVVYFTFDYAMRPN